MSGEGAGARVEAAHELELDSFAPYLINRISARYNADMAEALRRHGLTTPRMRALAVLAVKPGLTVNECAVFAVMEQSTMSRTLDALQEAGLVARRPRDGDGRVREVVLTEAGEAAFSHVWPLMKREQERMLAGIAPAERAAFLATLRKVLLNIRNNPF